MTSFVLQFEWHSLAMTLPKRAPTQHASPCACTGIAALCVRVPVKLTVRLSRMAFIAVQAGMEREPAGPTASILTDATHGAAANDLVCTHWCQQTRLHKRTLRPPVAGGKRCAHWKAQHAVERRETKPGWAGRPRSSIPPRSSYVAKNSASASSFSALHACAANALCSIVKLQGSSCASAVPGVTVTGLGQGVSLSAQSCKSSRLRFEENFFCARLAAFKLAIFCFPTLA